MRLSIITTLFRSADFVELFCERAEAAARLIAGDDFEIILVDDGSPDESLELAKGLLDQCPNLRIIELSRNFGHHPAILAGLEAAKGDLIFLIDSDLEEAPELVVEFHRIMIGQGVDVVFGYHNRNGQGVVRRWTGNGFWWLIRQITDLDIHPNLANVRLMSRDYVQALTSMPDRNVFLGGMFAWPGFKQLPVPITRQERDGVSTYSWRARLRLAALAAVAFSDRPLYLVFWLGMAITAASLLVGAGFILAKIINPHMILDGYTSLIVSLWFLGGVMIGSLGTVGFYIAHIYDQSRGRPRYVVRSRYGRRY